MAASELVWGTTDSERRQLNPDYYEVLTPIPRGSHVMVIDDTWASGGHAQSVAMALKHAGAAKVSILAIARWLDLRGRTKRTHNDHISNRPYDPAICPWTGAKCPLTPTRPTTSATPTLIPWHGFSYDAPGRIAPACRMIADVLSDGGWHRWKDITVRVADAYQLQPTTVSKLLQGMIKTGGIELSDDYRPARRRRGRDDAREVRLS